MNIFISVLCAIGTMCVIALLVDLSVKYKYFGEWLGIIVFFGGVLALFTLIRYTLLFN